MILSSFFLDSISLRGLGNGWVHDSELVQYGMIHMMHDDTYSIGHDVMMVPS